MYKIIINNFLNIINNKFYFKFLFFPLKRKIKNILYNKNKINFISCLLNYNKNKINIIFNEIKIKPYAFWGISNSDTLYVLIRLLKPKVVVETGIYYGLSSFYILYALHRNNKGYLYSIDIKKKTNDGKEIGFLVPKKLRYRWKIIIADAKKELPILLKKLNKIDIFVQDSFVNYEDMLYAFKLAFKYLNKNGLLISDNVDLNDAFISFCKKNRCKWAIFNNVGYCIKL